jgi:hypothetical protein
VRLLLILALAGCGKSEIDRERAAKLYREVTLDTAPGLSGLAADDTGGIWTVAERRDEAYRITLDAQNKPTLETFPIENAPDDFDLEGIAWLGGSTFAFGTEGKTDGVATVLAAERRGDAIAVTRAIDLPATQLAIPMRANHGAEGLCGAGDVLIAAIEGAGVAGGKRFAPIVRIESGSIVRTHRLWLTSETGKISAVDCAIAPDGTADVIAIERHFEVTKILRFAVPTIAGDIVPTVALDLGPVIKGQLNLEGIARTSDGRVVAVTDNHWKIVQGPSLLLVFEASAIR